MIHPMQDVGRAIDLWLGELARLRRSPRTRDSYRRHLHALADTLPPYTAVDEITADHCRRFLDRWIDAEASTMCGPISCLNGFFAFLIAEGHVPHPGPMVNVHRPRRKRPEDLAVVTISDHEAALMLQACATWQELLCIAIALLTGRRRAALNAARRRDVDLERRTITLVDKGDKTIVQRIPADLVAIIRAADEDGVWSSPGDYLIPSRRPSTVTRKLRKDSVIYDTVKIVAARAGVESHVHALRAAFAVQFDEQHPDRGDTLRSLMGHDRWESTQVYLRRKNRRRDQEIVDDLSFGLAPLPSPGWNRDDLNVVDFPGNAAIRPIRDSNPCWDDPEQGSGVGDDTAGSGRSLLERKLEEVRARDRERRGVRRG